jgi:hypothetical protein
MRKSSLLLFVIISCAAGPTVLRATPATLTFEGFADSSILTNQYVGVTFSNAVILTSGISLNQFEFPPHSGSNVVSDNGGPISIDFATPITSFGGYFTYSEALTIKALNASDVLVGSAASLFTNNLALSGVPGSSPNEFIYMAVAAGISEITINGDLQGGSFTLDDASYSKTLVPTPEPSSVWMFSFGLGLCFCLRQMLRYGSGT